MAVGAGNPGMRGLIGPAVVLALVVASDQITKLWAVNNLALRQPVEVIGTLLQFTLVYNRGGAMGTNFGSVAYYLISSILILGFVLYYLYTHRHIARLSYPLALIAGGAIGNIIDRIRLGEVIDFIDVDIFDINLLGFELRRWWTFNIADAAISLSIVYLVISLLLHRHEPVAEPPVAPDGSDDRARAM